MSEELLQPYIYKIARKGVIEWGFLLALERNGDTKRWKVFMLTGPEQYKTIYLDSAKSFIGAEYFNKFASLDDAY